MQQPQAHAMENNLYLVLKMQLSGPWENRRNTLSGLTTQLNATR